jgi:hypothetical protein
MSKAYLDTLKVAMNPTAFPQIELVCVTHKPKLYERHIASNPHLRDHTLIQLDNRSVKLGVALRYNEFLDSRPPSDSWIVFVHHDFELHEDPANVLSNLSEDSIYGPIGARVIEEVPIEQTNSTSDRSKSRSEALGEIACSHEHTAAARTGRRIDEPQIVDTLDACCLIAHSSLITRHGLRFDPNLPWHLYSEDFSLSAWSAHRIPTRVVQIESGHYGVAHRGITFDDQEFARSADYLVRKHHGRAFASTCDRLIKNRATMLRQGEKGITAMPKTDAAVAKR